MGRQPPCRIGERAAAGPRSARCRFPSRGHCRCRSFVRGRALDACLGIPQHRRSQENFAMADDTETKINQNTMDKDYDLISVLYHALQAADTCARYRQDAETEGS